MFHLIEEQGVYVGVINLGVVDFLKAHPEYTSTEENDASLLEIFPIEIRYGKELGAMFGNKHIAAKYLYSMA